MTFEEILHQRLDEISSKEKRDRLLEEAVHFFLEMKSKMESGDPQQREEAIERLTKIQAQLSARKNSLSKMTGLTPSQFDAISRLGKEHEAVRDAKAKLQEIFKPKSRPNHPQSGRLPV
jgi:hypothetical protein